MPGTKPAWTISLKADAVINTIAEENRFMYRYFLEGLHASGKAFMHRNPMNRYADSRDAAAPEDIAQAEAAPAPEAGAAASATSPLRRPSQRHSAGAA